MTRRFYAGEDRCVTTGVHVDRSEEWTDLMVKIELRGTRDPRVLEAMAAVPRDRFVPARDRALAFQDSPLPIGEDQTISQPSLVARMTAELHLTENARVLEIGTGCGYQTAILARLARDVYTIEVRGGLSRSAQERLRGLGYTNIRYRVGDGILGWPEESPFDAIIVTAAAASLPDSLIVQLRIGGRMIIPVGGDGAQKLLLVTRLESGPKIQDLLPVRFVPIVPRDPLAGLN